MQSIARALHRSTHSTRLFQIRSLSMTPKVHSEWEGRQPEEHVTNREDELDIQSGASKSGKRDRAVDSGHSQATTEKDHGSQNERAAKDHPEAPKPVIGMNDERGQKGQ